MFPQHLTGNTSATRNASLLRVSSSTDRVSHSTYRSRLWVGRETISRFNLLLTHRIRISVLKAVFFNQNNNFSDTAGISAWHSWYKIWHRPLSMRVASFLTTNYRVCKQYYPLYCRSYSTVDNIFPFWGITRKILKNSKLKDRAD
jgi:hypothetical protein